MSSKFVNTFRAITIYFPILVSTVLSIIVCSYLFGKPLTGFLIGIGLGFLIGRLTAFVYDIVELELYDSGIPRYYSGEFAPSTRVPFLFFYVWYRFLKKLLKGLFVIFIAILIFNLIVGIALLIVHFIKQGY